MAMAKSFSLLYAEFMGPWEVTGNRYEASGSFPIWPVREYSARNCSTERISCIESLVGLGGEAWGAEGEAATAELGGADVACGEVGRGEVGRGEVGGGEVDRFVVTIGEVVVMIGEVVGAMGEAMVVIGDVGTGAEIGSEARGRDGGIGSSDCTLSPPTAP